MQNGSLAITLEYCAPCGYSQRAAALTQDVMANREIEYHIRSWTLIPSSGGCFELTINGETVFSKKAQGRHAEPNECLNLIQAHLPTLMP